MYFVICLCVIRSYIYFFVQVLFPSTWRNRSSSLTVVPYLYFLFRPSISVPIEQTTRSFVLRNPGSMKNSSVFYKFKENFSFTLILEKPNYFFKIKQKVCSPFFALKFLCVFRQYRSFWVCLFSLIPGVFSTIQEPFFTHLFLGLNGVWPYYYTTLDSSW